MVIETVPVWMTPSAMVIWFRGSEAFLPVNEIDGNMVLLDTE